MANLDDKTTIPARWAVGIIITGAGLIATAAVAYTDNSRNTAEVSRLKDQVNANDRRILLLEERWQTIDKIDKKLDRVMEKIKER